MILTLTLTLSGLIVTWVALSYVVGVEEGRKERLLFSGLRNRLDSAVVWANQLVSVVLHYLDRHVIKLSWYYSLHSLLQAALRVVVALYDYLEQTFHINRKRARAIRAERRSGGVKSSMLQSVAEHKENTALSSTQKKKLRNKKLERE